MTERNIERKYDILKARITALIEEHADALALAQYFKENLDETNVRLKQANEKISFLERKLEKYDIQKEESKSTITRISVDSTEK